MTNQLTVILSLSREGVARIRHAATAAWSGPLICLEPLEPPSGSRPPDSAEYPPRAALPFDTREQYAMPLSRALACVTTPLVYVAPVDYLPLASGLKHLAILLHRNTRAAAAGGLTLAYEPGDHRPGDDRDPDELIWQLALAPKAIRQPLATSRVRDLGRNYCPVTGFVHRTAILQQAAELVAAAALRDPLLEELLLAFEMAIRGRMVSAVDRVMAIGPARTFEKYRVAPVAYRRIFDSAWFGRFSAFAPKIGGRLEQRHRLTRLSVRNRMKGWVRNATGDTFSFIRAGDDLIRSAVGDTLFAIMADRILAGGGTVAGLQAMFRQLDPAGLQVPVAAEQEGEIRALWRSLNGAKLDGSSPQPLALSPNPGDR